MKVRVIHNGKVEYYEYKDLMHYREHGFPDEIIPFVETVIGEVVDPVPAQRPPKQTGYSSSVHGIIGNIIANRPPVQSNLSKAIANLRRENAKKR